MIKNLIVLPDGSEIYSGQGTNVALKNVKFTDCVNSDTEIAIGSACSNCLEATIISPGGELSIITGTEVEYYKVKEDNTRDKVGLFTLEKPTRASANIYKITAYDRMTWFDKDVTEWLLGLTAWPYKLYDFAAKLCAECGLALKNTNILNGEYEIQQFVAEGITGRKLLRWIGEICACYSHITEDGEVEFTWYKECEDTIGPASKTDENGNQVFAYYKGTLSYEDFQIAKIDKVQIKQSDTDIGVIYPDSDGSNAYVIENNYLISSKTEDELLPVVQNIYNVLKDVQYTPCKVSATVNTSIRAGNIVSITDINGIAINMYVMNREESGQKVTYEATGSRSRNSVYETNRQSYKRLGGRILELTKTVEGLKIKNEDLEGKYSELSLDVDGFTSEVSKTYDGEELVSRINQTAGKVKINAGLISLDGDTVIEEGFILSAAHIDSKLYTATGTMYIYPEETEVLRVNKLVLGLITPTEDDYTWFDYDGSGTFTALDLLICKKLAIGIETIDNVVSNHGYNPPQFDVTISINPTNQNSALLMSVEAYGRTIERYIGTNKIRYNTAEVTSLTTNYFIVDRIMSDVDVEGDLSAYKITQTSSNPESNPNTFESNLRTERYVQTANATGYQCLDVNGTYRGIAAINADNNYVLAAGAIKNNLYIGSFSETSEECTQSMILRGNNSVQFRVKSAVRAYDDGRVSLGTSSYRWTNIYAVNGTIQTSDKNYKTDITDIDDKYLSMLMDVEVKTFKMLEGTSDRKHVGYVAQDVEEKMAKYDISDLDFAGFCKDIKQKNIILQEETRDSEGEVVQPEISESVYVYDDEGNPEYIYSLRYDEFVPLNTRAIQKHDIKLKEQAVKIEELEVKLNEQQQQIDKLKMLVETLMKSTQ